VENETPELLTGLRAATERANEGQEILAMAKWSGSEYEDALRLSLKRLEDTAAS
jgi:hypothetical protein